jgi:hypothetical protein
MGKPGYRNTSLADMSLPPQDRGRKRRQTPKQGKRVRALLGHGNGSKKAKRRAEAERKHRRQAR